jgi:hypothetical protein
MARIIGITHRVKKTVKGEARPTLVCILDSDTVTEYKLEDERAELDFVLGQFPSKYRPVTDQDLLTGFQPHQVKWRKLKKEENPADLPNSLLRQSGKIWEIATKVPIAFDGLKAGDSVAMLLGGSGDRLAYAIANRGQKIGVTLWRIPPAAFVNWRQEKGKENDHRYLAELFVKQPTLFTKAVSRDLALIELREYFYRWQDAMKARLACERRLSQRLIGQIFLSEEGQFPEGSLKDFFAGQQANDLIYQALLAEEAQREKVLKKLVRQSEAWPVFQEIKGCGELLAARIICGVGDIRRFTTSSRPDGRKTTGEARFKAFCGVHVLSGGKYGQRPERLQFARKRLGEAANWQNIARQAFWLLVANQFNRQKKSAGGQLLLQYKEKFHQLYPEPICRECQTPFTKCQQPKKHKKVYSASHLHKRAVWRVATKMAEQVYGGWKALQQQNTSQKTEKN